MTGKQRLAEPYPRFTGDRGLIATDRSPTVSYGNGALILKGRAACCLPLPSLGPLVSKGNR